MTPTASPSLVPLLDDPALRVLAPGAGPYPGDVVAHDAAPVARVSAVDAAPMWHARGEHVAGVQELVRTSEGHAVLLPLCTETVAEVLTRRAAAGEALRRGEVVTLAVSILRGTAAECDAHGADACSGRWWLAEDGTPLFVHDAAGAAAAPAAAQELQSILDAGAADAETDVVVAVTGAIAAIDDAERRASVLAAVEADLFALGSAEAIRVEPTARRRTARRSSALAPETLAPPERRTWRRLADAADAGVAQMASDAITQAWRFLRRGERRRPRSRRAVVMLAAAAGALVLAAGLLWPTGSDPAAIDATGVPAAPAVDTTGAPPAAAASPAPDPPDPVTATAEVLEAIRACGDDSGCRRALQDADRAVSLDGAAFAASDARTLTLRDDLGGLVLLRADDTTGERPPQIVEMVRTSEKWLLRDIHDVAQQPGAG